MDIEHSSELIEAAKHREENGTGNCFNGSIDIFYKVAPLSCCELKFVCFTPYNVNKEKIIHFVVEIGDKVYDSAGVLAQEEGKEPHIYHHGDKDDYYRDTEHQAKLEVGTWDFGVLKLNRAQFHASCTVHFRKME